MSARVAQPRAGDGRASLEPALNPVHASDPLKDPTSSEYRELHELKQRDREVRQHEQAHVAAGGAHVNGGASFSYTTGPDGRRYATGGEVSIDTAAVPSDPEATIRKMQAIRSAATAPANPSAQDRSVAAEAARAEAEARMQLREEEAGERTQARAEAPDNRSQAALDAYRLIAGADRGDAPRLDLTA